MAESAAPQPTLEQGQTIRTMRDDLERIRSGQTPITIPAPPPNLTRIDALEEELAPPSTNVEPFFSEPLKPIEQQTPLQPEDFDLLSHLSKNAPMPELSQFSGAPRQTETPPTPLAQPTPFLSPEKSPAASASPKPPPPPPLPPQDIRDASQKTYTQTPTTTSARSATMESPLRPEELLALEEETLQSSGRHLFSLRLPRIAILGIAGILLVGIIAIAAYLFFFRGEKQENSPPPTPPANESPSPVAATPPPLLPIPTTTKTIPSLDDARVDLHETFAQHDTSGTLTALALKLENDQEQKYLSLDDILASLDITFPQNILSSINAQSYTLFLFHDSQNGNTRVGFAFKISDSDALASAMAQWESTMPTDLDALLLNLGKTEEPADMNFHTTVRNGLTNHYLNFTEPTTSIDYTIDPSRKILLIATSRDSMYAAIDALTGG